MEKKIVGFEDTFLKGNPAIHSYGINPEFEAEYKLVREENPDMDLVSVVRLAINRFIEKNGIGSGK